MRHPLAILPAQLAGRNERSLTSPLTASSELDGDLQVERFAHYGLAAVRLRSSHVEVVVLPGKGADVCSFRCLSTNTQMLAECADAPTIASDFRQRGAVGYGDCFIGGWPSLLPSRARASEPIIGPDRCGEAATVPFEAFDSLILDAYRLICSAELPRSGLRVVRTFGFDATGRTLQIRVDVTNRRPSPIEFHWTEHPTFGSDLLAGDFELLLPPCTAHTSRTAADDGLPSDRVQLDAGPPFDLRDARVRIGEADLFRTLRGPIGGWMAVFNPARGVGVHLRWDGRQFPNAWYWQSHRDGKRMLAIEPSNSHRTELCDDPDGPPLRLEPGASMSTPMSLEVIDAAAAAALRRSLSPDASGVTEIGARG